MQYSNFIKESLEEVAEIARENFGKVSGVVKEGNSNYILTETDIAIGKNLIAKISKVFPEHNIIDEEAGVINKGSEYTWTIDPIDGTSNFASGAPLYGIMLGLLKNDIPIAGGAALPSFNEIYTAEKGEGAFCNGEKISVTQEKKLQNVLVSYEIDGHRENPEFTRKECALMSEIILNVRNLRVANSIFDNMQVAKGNYGACLNRTSKVWDNTVYQIIVEEAGGIHTDFFGKEMNYSGILNDPERNFTFCVASPEIHKQLMEIILK